MKYHVVIFKVIKFYNNAKKFQVFIKTLVDTPGTNLQRNFKLTKTQVLFRYNPKLMRRDLLGKRHQAKLRSTPALLLGKLPSAINKINPKCNRNA